MPPGFYWRCNDCDIATREQNKPLFRCIQRLKEAFSIGSKVKSEPLVTDETEDNGRRGCKDDARIDEYDDEVSQDKEEYYDEEEEEFTCVPHRGYFCDICHYCTFDSEAFTTHVASEEAKIQSVQESISTSPWNSNTSKKTCIKCGTAFGSWKDLFQHVTTFHSRPLDFPQFGDLEWKFLMSHQGKLKRSCCYCGQQFENTQQWIAHMKISIDGEEKEKELMAKDYFKVENDDAVEIDKFNPLDDEVLKCTDCDTDQVFNSADAFKIHRATFHHRTKSFLCAFCPFDGDTVKDLNQHVHLEHEGNFNKCLECDFETWAHSVLRRHVNVKHRKVKSFGCQHCSFTAMTKPTLVAHINRQHSKDKVPIKSVEAGNAANFTCCFCSFITTSKKAFQDHFDEEHEGNRTQCLECDFKAPVVSHLRRHVDSVHRGLKKFPCQHCEHRATTKQGLERHVRVRHCNIQDLNCPHCDYKTSAPDALRTHARKCHEQVKDVVKDELNHKDPPPQRKYFGNRTPIPMVCRLCGEEAPTTNKLAAHFADCHPFEKPFWCLECNIGYETYYGIQNHNRKDHSEERHLCPVCGYSTHGPQYLKRHFRRKHPNYYEQIHAQQERENQAENKVSADEKMKVALELKGLSDEEISERVKALIQQSEDGVWTCAKCQRRFEGKPKRALYSHIRERHFHMRHFKCKECNFLSYNRAEIQEHKEKHKSDKPIHQCDLCGFICDNSTGLIRHKRGRFCQNQNLQRRKRDRDK